MLEAMKQVVHIVDDDEAVRESLKAMLDAAMYSCATYGSAEAFLKSARPIAPGCALIDVRMPHMDGLTLLYELSANRSEVAVIIMTGFDDVPLAVKAMKAGAVDFVEKPCAREELIDAIERALAKTKAGQTADGDRRDAQARLHRLTQRERDVLKLVVAGDSNKTIAHSLGISPRTVEIHRSRLMEKTQVKNLAELIRLALAAGVPRKDA
jgi:two-component system response regulator FixJ